MIGTEDLKSESECWFLHASCHWAQMPHSTERGGDLTTLGARGWTNRTLEEVHDVVDAGLGVEHDEGEVPGSRRGEMMQSRHFLDSVTPRCTLILQDKPSAAESPSSQCCRGRTGT